MKALQGGPSAAATGEGRASSLSSSCTLHACLKCIARHLIPGGLLVVHLDHQDMGWLGDLRRDKGGVFEVEALYGDLYRAELTDDSEGMIWVAKKRGTDGPAAGGDHSQNARVDMPIDHSDGSG